MNKKIKVIELYERLAKQENMPKKINYNGFIFYKEFDTFANVYFYETENGTQLLSMICSTALLNDEVEILKDEEEIDIQSIERIPQMNIDNCTDPNYAYLGEKYNKVIEAVKQLDKKINKE